MLIFAQAVAGCMAGKAGGFFMKKSNPKSGGFSDYPGVRRNSSERTDMAFVLIDGERRVGQRAHLADAGDNLPGVEPQL